jgi:hypothetical protein
MKFRTEIFPEKLKSQINYSHQIMALGSCFAENIGSRLLALKYNIDINPFGIQYNPASIAEGLNRIISGNAFEFSDLFEYQGEWHSFSHHSDFSDGIPEMALSKMNSRLEAAVNSISKTNFLMLTLGTAWIFAQKENSVIVNNCHKLPSANFIRKRLSVEETIACLELPLKKLTAANPNLQIIISISPIRHLKDGLHENQLSKASLLLAVDRLCAEMANIHYFPAYEILIDDLRDYRFYASDLTHPSEQAIDYVWEKFEENCLQSTESQLRKDIANLVQASNHRLFNPKSEKSRKFAQSQLQAIEVLSHKNSTLNFEKEYAYFSSILNQPQIPL